MSELDISSVIELLEKRAEDLRKKSEAAVEQGNTLEATREAYLSRAIELEDFRDRLVRDCLECWSVYKCNECRDVDGNTVVKKQPVDSLPECPVVGHGAMEEV